MELIDPDIGLIVWSFLCFISLGITVMALFKLLGNRQLDLWRKLFWAALIVFVPTVGAFIYIVYSKTGQQKSSA